MDEVTASGTWIPSFDRGDEYQLTVYEENSVLNWFRGIIADGGGLHDVKMTEQWCSNVLRMISPLMWLNKSLSEQVDRTALAKVADLKETPSGLLRVRFDPIAI